MINGKTIAVVVPAYNEETQIGLVIESMPDFVDRIVIVNDCSKDKTAEVVKTYFGKLNKASIPEVEKVKKNLYNRADLILEELNKKELEYFAPSEVITSEKDEKIVLINLLKNSGVGGAIARGYKWAKDNLIDCTAVMAGDGQMDPDELESICLPVIEENIDYVKGNRLSHKSAAFLIPKKRFIGNSILSILTKVASGYWSVSDTQTGYTAISLKALQAIKLYKIYPRYGMPNDMLVKLNIACCTLKEVPIKPIYNVGEQSKMKVRKIVLPIIWLLKKSFFQRIWNRYLIRDFHPLFILYHFAFILLGISIPYGAKIIAVAIQGLTVNPLTAIAFMFSFISGFQSLLFAMWMDIQNNDKLNKS
ncbi:MAG: glycosyltransferase family 2 protein [Bacteroidetes bacterium]|nr:glycosyltransferase family 2 protein [Bacteroidota bacterium]